MPCRSTISNSGGFCALQINCLKLWRVLCPADQLSQTLEGFVPCRLTVSNSGGNLMHLFNIYQLMSGHGATTSKEVQGQAILREIADYCTLEGNIDHDKAFFDYFSSELA